MQEPAAPPSTDQLIAAGWGYVSLSTTSIQADNGAGLTAGVIGLTNLGKRRTPSSGERCGRGPGARPARSTTWRHCPRWMPDA